MILLHIAGNNMHSQNYWKIIFFCLYYTLKHFHVICKTCFCCCNARKSFRVAEVSLSCCLHQQKQGKQRWITYNGGYSAKIANGFYTAQIIFHGGPPPKFSMKNFFSKCDQIRRKLRIWSHLLKNVLMESFIICAIIVDVWQSSK